MPSYRESQNTIKNKNANYLTKRSLKTKRDDGSSTSKGPAPEIHTSSLQSQYDIK